MGLRILLQLAGAFCSTAGLIVIFASLYGWDSWCHETGMKGMVHEHAGKLFLIGCVTTVIGCYLAPPIGYERLSADAFDMMNELSLSELRGRSPIFVLGEISLRLVGLAAGCGSIYWSGKAVVETHEGPFLHLAIFLVGFFVAIYVLKDLRQFIWPSTITNEAMAQIVGHVLVERARRTRFLLHASFWDRLSFGAIFYQMCGAIRGVFYGFLAWLGLTIVNVPDRVRHDPWVSLSGLARETVLDPWTADFAIVHVLSRLWPGEIGTILERESFLFLLFLAALVLCFGEYFLYGVTSFGDYAHLRFPDPSRLAWWGGLFAAPFLLLLMNGLGALPLPRFLVWYLLWLCIINICSLGAYSYDKGALEHNRSQSEPPSQAGNPILARRLPEDKVALLSLYGGEFGAWLGRLLLGHKVSNAAIELRVASRILFGRHLVSVAGFVVFVTWINSFLKS